jgi:hypothetical protein
MDDGSWDSDWKETEGMVPLGETKDSFSWVSCVGSTAGGDGDVDTAELSTGLVVEALNSVGGFGVELRGEGVGSSCPSANSFRFLAVEDVLKIVN